MKKTATLLSAILLLLGSLLLSGFLMGCGGGSEQQATSPVAGDLLDFELGWQKGDRFLQRITMESETRSEGSRWPGAMNTSSSISQDTAITILEKRPDGGYTILMEFIDMKLDSRAGTNVIFFDTSSDEVNKPGTLSYEVAKILPEMKLEYQLDARGKMEAMEGFSSFEESLNSILKGKPPLFIGMIRGLLSREALRNWVLHFSLEAYPDRPVKIGESWPYRNEVTIQGMNKIVSEIEHTFTGWETRGNRRCALLKIDGTAEMETDPDREGKKIAFGPEDITIRGDTFYEPGLGLNLESSLIQNMKMKLNMFGNANREVTTSIENRINMHLVEMERGGKKETFPVIPDQKNSN